MVVNHELPFGPSTQTTQNPILGVLNALAIREMSLRNPDMLKHKTKSVTGPIDDLPLLDCKVLPD